MWLLTRHILIRFQFEADFNTHNYCPDEVNGGHRVDLLVMLFPFMYDTLWLVFIKVEKKQPKVTHSSKTFNISHETKVNLENLVQLTSSQSFSV